ncbi:hypothetical protein V8F33_011212 [Rhypophila sp. PSN 637]
MVTTRLSLVAALSATTALAQFGPPPTTNVGQGCTSKSISVPSWIIQNLGKVENDVKFNITNRATGYTSGVRCKQGASDCLIAVADGGLKASIQLDGNKVQFAVNQTWTCNDRGTDLTFTALGNNSAPLNWTSPLLIRGSLLAPVAITPAYLEGPTGHKSPGCAATSEKPSWKLSAIHFTDQTGDGTSSTPFQMFNLLLTNPANGYEASCMPGTSYDYGNDLSTLVCAGVEFQSSSIGGFPITTTASFDTKTFTFSVKQTWFCDDHDASKPQNITASGTIKLPLECETNPVPDSPNDTKKSCIIPEEGDITMPGTVDALTILAPFVIEDPIPQRDGCTLTSIFNPKWSFSQFSVTTTPAGKEDIFFNIILAAENRGFQFPIPIYTGEAVKGKEGWYNCVVGQDGENAAPLWPYQCEFKYENATKNLEIRADWACVDFDPEHPILFSGVSSTTVSSPFECGPTYDGNNECVIDGSITWSADIQNVTWNSSP